MPKKGFKVITVKEDIWRRLNLLAIAAGYRGHGAVTKYLRYNVCNLRP